MEKSSQPVTLNAIRWITNVLVDVIYQYGGGIDASARNDINEALRLLSEADKKIRREGGRGK